MDPLPPLPDGAKMLTQAPALPPLPTGATMLTDHTPPKATTPIDTGPDMAPPSATEQAVRGAYGPVDALLTLVEHGLGGVAASGARLATQAAGDVIDPAISAHADQVHDAVANLFNRKPVTSEGQTDVSAIPGAISAGANAINTSSAGQAGNALIDKLTAQYPKTAAFLKQAAQSTGDVMNTVGAVTGGEGATADSLAAARAQELPAPPIHDPVEQLKAAGYKIPETAGDVDAARAVAPDVTAELAKRAAGLSSDQQITSATLKDAKAPHNAVYNQAYASLPDAVPAASDPKFAAAVDAAGATPGTLTPKSPAVDALKAKAMANDTLTPAQIQANIGNMREDGYTNINSGDTDKTALGRTQLDLAKAHEDLVERNLPADGPVDINDLKNARVALAKINMVQRNLVGEDVNPAGIAREARDNPGMVNGELQLIANLHDFAPKIAGLPQRAALPGSGVLKSLATAGTGAAIGHVVGGVPGALIGGALNSHELIPSVIDAFKRAMRSGANVPEDLSKAGLGDMFTRGNGLPPNWGRELPADLSTPEAPLALASGQPAAAPSGPADQIPLHELLSGGVEQPPAAGMTLQTPAQAVAGRAPPAANFVPSEAERLSGGLSLADQVAAAAHPNNSDLAPVMSQGVPEDIMSRTPRAGGEPLSLEPSQARGEGFAMNPIGSEPTLHELLSGTRGTAEGHTLPTDLPEGKALTADVFRGVPKGADAADTTNTIGGALSYSPDHATAMKYAGADGSIAAKTVKFKNALDVGSLPQTIAQLGLPRTANMVDVVKAAQDAGYDGLRYSLGGTNNDVEIVDLKPKKGK
jgi:hypothetical protein